MGVFFGGEMAGNTADAPLPGGWRVPLVSYVTVRMQSDFREDSLSGTPAPIPPAPDPPVVPPPETPGPFPGCPGG